ncbi:hypothetical protein A3Q56_06021, partial [Intoshia linei]
MDGKYPQILEILKYWKQMKIYLMDIWKKCSKNMKYVITIRN